MTMLDIKAPPASLVDASGHVAHGIFDRPCPRANLDEARVDWLDWPLPRALARLRLKQWQHFALILPEAFLGVAVVDLGFVSTSWCFVLDRVTGAAHEHKRLGPILDLQVAGDLWHERSWARAPAYRVEIENALDAGEHRLELAIEAAPGKPAVEGSLRCAHDLAVNRPMVVCMPVGPGRSMYSHKVALPLEGELRIGGRKIAARSASSFAILDVHKAHYPRHTWWLWSTLAGRTAGGSVIAVNLTRNMNIDDDRINENALWVDGAIQHLGPARFDHDRAAPLRPWKVGTVDGAVDLTFTPAGERKEELALGLFRSVFHQPHGTYRGTVRFAGQPITVDGFFGICEDHDSIW